MLVCSGGDFPSPQEKPVTFTDASVTTNKEKAVDKTYVWKHGSKSPTHC